MNISLRGKTRTVAERVSCRNVFAEVNTHFCSLRLTQNVSVLMDKGHRGFKINGSFWPYRHLLLSSVLMFKKGFLNDVFICTLFG